MTTLRKKKLAALVKARKALAKKRREEKKRPSAPILIKDAPDDGNDLLYRLMMKRDRLNEAIEKIAAIQVEFGL